MKNCKQRNIVKNHLMKVLQLSIHRQCLPGDRNCKSERLTIDMLQQIVKLAQDNFQLFKDDTIEHKKSIIENFCRIAASNAGKIESETPKKERNGDNDKFSDAKFD